MSEQSGRDTADAAKAEADLRKQEQNDKLAADAALRKQEQNDKKA